MKVSKISTSMVTIFYILMAMFGYFSTLGRTTDIILLRDNLPGLETDYFMVSASVAVLIVMVVNCVTNFLPFRMNFF